VINRGRVVINRGRVILGVVELDHKERRV